jgi:hypothetical protein
MDKRRIEIAGYTVIQIDETEYEAENKEQGLDFYFDAGHPDAVEVFVFDSTVETKGDVDPCIAAFYAGDLETAVRQAMALTRRSLQGTRRYYGVVLRLRGVARHLEAEQDAEEKTVLFPGWHEGFEEESEPLIRSAARAILAEGVGPDDGTYISKKEMAALLQYIADMME